MQEHIAPTPTDNLTRDNEDRPTISYKRAATSAVCAWLIVAICIIVIFYGLIKADKVDGCSESGLRYRSESAVAANVCDFNAIESFLDSASKATRVALFVTIAIAAIVAGIIATFYHDYIKVHYRRMYGVARINRTYRESTRFGDRFHMILVGQTHDGVSITRDLSFDSITWFEYELTDEDRRNGVIKHIDLREQNPVEYN